MLLKFPLMMLLAGLVWAVTSLVCVSDARAVADPVDLYVEALLDADVESLDRLLASNFIFIGSNGHVQDKEHFLQTTFRSRLEHLEGELAARCLERRASEHFSRNLHFGRKFDNIITQFTQFANAYRAEVFGYCHMLNFFHINNLFIGFII